MHEFDFLGELVLIGALAVAIILVFQRLKIPPVIGLIFTGILLGPSGIAAVYDQKLISTLAELGVILLLFTIGLEFSLDDLKKLKKIVLVGGIVQILVTGLAISFLSYWFMLVIDRGITFADLAGVIETFTAAYFGPDIHSRLRPAYFPFPEPSAEFEITCTICRGEGCRTCSRTGWIELGGCGMVDPAVFAAVGIDPAEWSGFAFGFGIDRCAQMRHQIADMRSLIENDLRFMRQF